MWFHRYVIPIRHNVISSLRVVVSSLCVAISFPESTFPLTSGSGYERLWDKAFSDNRDRAEKRLRMRAVDSFWRIFDRLINEGLAP